MSMNEQEINKWRKLVLYEKDWAKRKENIALFLDEAKEEDIENLLLPFFNLEKLEATSSDIIYLLSPFVEGGAGDAEYGIGLAYYRGKGIDNDDDECVRWLKKGIEKGNVKCLTLLGACYEYGAGVYSNISIAEELYRECAEQGYAHAQFRLGRLYEEGKGVKQDYDEAFKWYVRGAEQGNQYAQYSLGFLYLSGEGVERDYEEASRWFALSASNGNVAAAFRLADLYFDGKGVEKDEKKALELLTESGDKGFVKAQIELGHRYENGEGVEQDYGKAFHYYLMAAEQGEQYAEVAVGFLLSRGQGVEKNLLEAAEWYRKASETGYALAQCFLGIAYFDGEGVEQDYDEAYRLFALASGQGEELAQYYLGLSYENGYGVEKNENLAMSLFLLSAEKGCCDAQVKLGDIFYNGGNCSGDDLEKAISWYTKASIEGNAESKYRLSCLHLSKPEKNEEDIARGLELLRSSAEGGYPAAQTSLGYRHYEGHLVEKDNSLAAKWFLAASEKGISEASAMMGLLFERGHGVPQDLDKAKEFYEKSISGEEEGQELGHLLLGRMLLFVEEDYEGAAKHFLKISSPEWRYAALALGYMAEKGLATGLLTEEASTYYEMAKNDGGDVENAIDAFFLAPFAEGGCLLAKDLLKEATKKKEEGAKEAYKKSKRSK